MEISRTTLGIAAGVAGTLFLGYCIYFDNKRRKDPDFKKKLRDRRRRQRKVDVHSGSKTEIPNLDDHEAVQRFFLQEIQIGEQLISTGDIDRGVEHLANAVIVCGQPTQLLQVLQQTLPSQVFSRLIMKMREVGNRTVGNQQESATLTDINDELE